MLLAPSDCIWVPVLPDADAHTHTHTNQKTNGLEIPDENMEENTLISFTEFEVHFPSEGTCVGESEQIRGLCFPAL